MNNNQNTDIRTKPRVSVQMFTSLDLVNSTLFKTKTHKWPSILDWFYSVSESQIIDKEKFDEVDRFRIWKYVGDEILFYRPINKLKDIHDSINFVYEKLNHISEEILLLCKKEACLPGLLDVKATIWIALIHHEKINDSIKQRNILRRLGPYQNSRSFDFLGPDIDVGFRVASHADRKKITISAKLAGVLLHKDCQECYCSKFIKFFRIVHHVRLKGVWHGAPYPIIWFHKDWENIESTFSYEERLDSSIHDLGDFSGKQPILNVLHENTRTLHDIIEILPMHGEQCDVEMIINGIKNTSIRQTKHYLEDIRHPLAEVHIAAIVLCEDNTHVLLALRSEEKTLFPGCWEFGCAQLSQGFTPIDLLKKDYKDDFDLDIRFTLDTPISTYSIDRSNSIVPGFIYTATADRSELLKDSSKKHSKIQWMDIATLNENTSIECSVPNLLRDINRAQKAQSMIINSSS